MFRLPIITLLALAPVAGAVDDPMARTDHAATAQRIRQRHAAGDLAVDVLVAHARRSDLESEFDALCDTLSPADRAACKRSLAEAARLTQRAATLCAFAERQIDRGTVNQTDGRKDRRPGAPVARFKLDLARLDYAEGIEGTEVGELLTRQATAQLANVADLLAGQ
jgi:hypothetical protein